MVARPSPDALLSGGYGEALVIFMGRRVPMLVRTLPNKYSGGLNKVLQAPQETLASAALIGLL